MVDPIPVGKIPSGLFVVTAVDTVNRMGFLASWIQQASFKPLLISLAVEPEKPIWGLIQSTGRFCVNIVGHQNNGLMKPFWGAKTEADPFIGLATEISAHGNLILTAAMASLDCELRAFSQPGDHCIVIGEVVETRLLQIADKPMTHVRKSGAGY